MSISGYITLRIEGNPLDFDYIDNCIKLQPTIVYRKGDLIPNKYGAETKVQKNDRWLYELKFDDSQDFNNVLNGFVSKLCIYRDYIKTLYKKQYVRLWCDLYTELGQFAILLAPETIQEIADLGIGCDIQIYSDGEVRE